MKGRTYFLVMLPAFAAHFCAAGAIEARHPEPVSRTSGVALQPLPVTEDTLLKLSFDAKGKPVVVPPGQKVSVAGKLEPLPAERDLPGFSGLVRIMGEASQKNKKGPVNFVEIAEAATLLSRGPFTIDAILRFSWDAGNFLEAGPEGAFQWGLVDRDAGTLSLRLPGEGKKGALAPSGLFERVGPLRRDRFGLYTLSYDGAGAFVFFIDGTECFRGDVKGLSGPLSLANGALRFGDVSATKSRFQGDLAELRIRRGVHQPNVVGATPPAEAVVSRAFDMKAQSAPSAPGYQAVTAADILGAENHPFGWTAKPEGETDLWFVGDRFLADAKKVTEQGTRRARAWQLRDAILLPSGEGFTSKIPPGLYAVAVTVGRTDKEQFVDRIEANGTVIGRDLVTLPSRAADSDDRTARGLVRVGADGLLRVLAFSREEDGKTSPVGFMNVSILPAPPLPVEREGTRLVWKAPLPAPPAFQKAAEAYAARNFDLAFQEAAGIPDAVARSVTRAWIVGYPELTDRKTLDRLGVIHDDLLSLLRQHPENPAAGYLEDMTLRLWHAAHAYVYQRPTSRIFGPAKGRAWREGLNLALQIQPGEPYFGQARMLAANLVWQYGQQAGGYLDDKTWRVPANHLAYAPPPPLFREVLKEYPGAELPRILLSNNVILNESGGNADRVSPEGRIPLEKTISIPEGAPEWAALQHRIVTRLIDLVSYWHDERMEEDGTMGGGFGDDVEMMRWFKTAVLVAGDSKAMDAWQRLAATGWKDMQGQPMPENAQDAEHVAEDFGDSHALQPLLHAGGDQYETFLSRSRLLLPILKGVLMERDPKGYLVFKGHRYSRNEVVKYDGDVPYNLRTLGPLAIHAYLRPDDKEVSDLIVAYARSWRDMTMQEIDGKPAGITPMMISFERDTIKAPKSDGKLKNPTDWVFPGYWTHEYPAGYTRHIYDLLLGAFYLSGDKTFLDPHKKALEFLGTLEGSGSGKGTTPVRPEDDPSPYPRGSLDWAIRINRSGLGLAGAQYRAATGDKTYDEILLKYGPDYTKFVILAERARSPREWAEATATLRPAFEEILDVLDYNEILRTKLPQSTDRIWVPGMDFVEATATGDLSAARPLTLRGEEEFWPKFGVTWLNTGSDVAALVSKNLPDRLEAYLYNFLETPKPVEGRLWNLTPGRYRLRLIPSPGFQDQEATVTKEFEFKQKGQLIEFEVPSREQVHLVVEPAGA